MTLPTFYLAGSARAGTTSLDAYCRAHPEVFMPSIKEPNYFIFGHAGLRFGGPRADLRLRSSIKDLKSYERLFQEANGAKAIGESSIAYMFYPQACAGIRAVTPNARIIFILRQPIDRAFSRYIYGKLQENNESADSFENAWRDDGRRATENWFRGRYRGNSFYYEPLKVWFDAFGRDQIRVYLYDQLHDDARSLMRDLYAFIGVDPSFEPDTTRAHNRAGAIANPLLRWAWHNSAELRSFIAPVLPLWMRGRFFRLIARSSKVAPTEKLDPDLRSRLTEEVREDILKTQDLIGIDLTRWLA